MPLVVSDQALSLQEVLVLGRCGEGQTCSERETQGAPLHVQVPEQKAPPLVSPTPTPGNRDALGKVGEGRVFKRGSCSRWG